MKIKILNIRGLRGFNNEVEIPCASGLNLVYAPNGWGKSSIAEAIEWAIFGDTQRRLDAKSKVEFEGTYRNVHTEPNVTSFVKLICEKKDNQEITIQREIRKTEIPEFHISPETESTLSIYPIRPIIYQHGLQRFIHTEPSKRWDEFANILGLAELENLREILLKVKNNKENAIPEEVKEIINKLSKLRQTIESLNQLQSLKKPVQKSAETFFLKAIKFAEHLVLKEEGNKDDIINELKSILKKRKAAIFDLSIFIMKTLDQSTLQQHENDKKYIDTFNKNVLAKIKEYRGQKRQEQDLKRLAFVKQGLELLPKDADKCPFCGISTISSELRKKLKEEVEESSATRELHQKVLKALGEMSSKIISLASPYINRLENSSPIFEKMDQIVKIIGDDQKEFLHSFKEVVKQRKIEWEELKSLKETAINAVESIKNQLDLTEFNEIFITNQIKNIELLVNKVDVVKDNYSNYLNFCNISRDKLQVKLSKREDIAIPELLLYVIISKKELEKAFLVEGYINQLDELRKKVELFHKQKTAEKLQEKKDDILKWYDILNPEEDVGFTGIREHQTRKRWLEILAKSYGEEMSGPACLSESHLNAVGISVYLAQIMGTLSPFQFIVIDDPVQSMDEKHSTRFADIIKEILNSNYQIILLSHQMEIINALCNQFQDSPKFGYLEIANFDKSGPVIKEKVPNFNKYLKLAKRFRTGDATCRSASFNFLRKATERLTKEVYIKGKKKNLAKRYESLDISKMEKLLVESGIPKYDDIIKMRETIKFSGPTSHDDMSKNPPTPEELNRHISRLEMYWKKWIQSSDK